MQRQLKVESTQALQKGQDYVLEYAGIFEDLIILPGTVSVKSKSNSEYFFKFYKYENSTITELKVKYHDNLANKIRTLKSFSFLKQILLFNNDQEQFLVKIAVNSDEVNLSLINKYPIEPKLYVSDGFFLLKKEVQAWPRGEGDRSPPKVILDQPHLCQPGPYELSQVRTVEE